MNKRLLSVLLTLAMILSISMMTGCSKDEEGYTNEDAFLESQMDPDYENNNDFDQPKYDSEGDGAEVVTVEHDVLDFIGVWDATSHRSTYMYGNVSLNIQADGTWKGNITDEDFHGRWTYNNGEVVIKDSEGIIDFTLFYNGDGYLMFKNNEVPEDAFVLEKHNANS